VLPACPTQKQLEARGATAGEVTAAAQMSTGKFPLTSTLIVSDEQCSYPGALGLLLVFWHLTPTQQAAAKAHLAYECKRKPCSVFVSKGQNTSTTVTVGSGGSSSGKAKGTTVTTLNEIVITAAVQGEATAKNPPKAAIPCDALARALYGFVAQASPIGQKHILEEAACTP
jgi:hypothetical protein